MKLIEIINKLFKQHKHSSDENVEKFKEFLEINKTAKLYGNANLSS